MLEDNKKRGIWIIYMPVALILVYAASYIQVNVTSYFNVDYVFFLLLAIIVALFPIRTEDSIVFLINGIALPVLVIFGLIPEMILSSIAIVALMLRSNIKRDQHYRYALNLLMINFLSLVSASFYYLTLRLLDQMTSAYALMLALTVYMIVQLLFNQITIYLIDRYYYDDERATLISASFNFTFFTNIIVLPLSFILIYLYEMIQLTGIFIGALPFITVTLGMNFYYKSRVNNKYLKKLTQYSQELSARKNRESIIDVFINALLQIFPIDALSYFSIQSEKTMKREKMIVKGHYFEKENEVFELSEQSVLREALLHNTIISRKNADEWKVHCLNDLSYAAESVMVIPVKVLEQTQGVILVSHKTQAMYDEMIVSLVEVFHKYFTIALDNAYHYEQLEESVETDFLTKLPNLKGLSKHLQCIKDEKSIRELSLIVLDLDHFKKVNDTHGHQAGNEILKQFSDLLQDCLKDDFFLARFGGEEFILLMPDHSVEDAYDHAEAMREKIVQTSFEVTKSILTNMGEHVSVTASLGVAHSLNQNDEIESLINRADRAMYIGSKQNGRNRTTVAK